MKGGSVEPGSLEYFQWFYEGITDPERIDGLWHEDVVIHQSEEMVGTAGTFEGYDGVVALGQELAESWDVEETVWRPIEVKELGDHGYLVRVAARGRGRGSGVELERELFHIVTLRGDRASRMDVYLDEAEARKAAGLG
jgi:ketosteroid isomerase-like protein